LSISYDKLLDRAYAQLPARTSTGERFEIPRIVGIRIGTRTIVQNFGEIADRLNRDPQHILKFLSKEMATAATYEGTRAIFQGKFNEAPIARLLEIYTQRFVICPICKRPDTKLEREDRFLFLRCEACGARSSVLPM
jgi:translation initiation factor 2 subunit 2